METVRVIVPPEHDGQRADVFLAEFVSEIPTRSAAQRLLSGGNILCRGRALAKNSRLKAGDELDCEIPAPAPCTAEAEPLPLDIMYEDGDLLVINKPRGMVVHPSAGHSSGTLVNALLHHCELSGIGGVLRPGIVHRLDKDTSGLMVAAKNDSAHIALSAQLSARAMGRTYNALVLGTVKNERFRINLPIGRHPTDRKKMAVLTDKRAREAATNVRVIERFESGNGRFTLVAAMLETGRTHQIRVHMAHIGHPVLGDLVYGPRRRAFVIAGDNSHVAAQNDPRRRPHLLNGQILHAKTLSFTHPATGKTMEFDSPLPKYFHEALKLIAGS